MIRILARLILNLLANAVGLAAAALLLDNFSISASAFIMAVLIFSITTTVLGPLIIKIALTNASYLMGGIALITSFVGLVVTNLISDGVSISGLSSWIIAPLIIWVFALIANLVLPLLLFKKALQTKPE